MNHETGAFAAGAWTAGSWWPESVPVFTPRVPLRFQEQRRHGLVRRLIKCGPAVRLPAAAVRWRARSALQARDGKGNSGNYF